MQIDATTLHSWKFEHSQSSSLSQLLKYAFRWAQCTLITMGPILSWKNCILYPVLCRVNEPDVIIIAMVKPREEIAQSTPLIIYPDNVLSLTSWQKLWLTVTYTVHSTGTPNICYKLPRPWNSVQIQKKNSMSLQLTNYGFNFELDYQTWRYFPTHFFYGRHVISQQVTVCQINSVTLSTLKIKLPEFVQRPSPPKIPRRPPQRLTAWKMDTVSPSQARFAGFMATWVHIIFQAANITDPSPHKLTQCMFSNPFPKKKYQNPKESDFIARSLQLQPHTVYNSSESSSATLLLPISINYTNNLLNFHLWQ